MAMAFDVLAPLIKWLAATPMSTTIGNTPWITPAVQCAHILAISAVMACMMMVNLRLLGAVGRDEAVASVSRRYGTWVWPALAVLLLSGSVLIVGEPRRSLENKIFLAKMTLVATAAILTFVLQRPLGRDAAFWDRGGRQRLAQAIAAISILLWVAIVFAGRWIAYTQE